MSALQLISHQGEQWQTVSVTCVVSRLCAWQALLEEMMANIADIVPSEHGRKVLHYLLSPRDTVYFHPTLVATLAEGDGNPTRSVARATETPPGQ